MKPQNTSGSFAIKSGLITLFFVTLSCTSSNHPTQWVEDNSIPAADFEQTSTYISQIQPLLDRRCVVCHTCNDAPCQLHLDSYKGLRRGATFADLGANVLYAPPTRDKDAANTAEWRQKQFFPVIPDPVINPVSNEANLLTTDAEQSLLYRFIELGTKHNKPGFPLEPTILHREKARTCAPTTAAFEDFARQHPFAGMPYGFPGLEKKEVQLLRKWIDQGAPSPSELRTYQESSEAQEQIAAWEQTLNANEKSALFGRYVYEHVFSAHIHFKGTPADEWYELVRSYTPHPEPLREIITARPYDPVPAQAPNSKATPPKVFYRFKRFQRTIARGAHIPWEIDRDKLERIKNFYIGTTWLKDHGDPKAEIDKIRNPGYDSVNPFKYFRTIPARLRYQFLLDNSQLIANAMIRGPACSGRIATNAIRDHFWVFFLKPEADVTVLNPDIALSEWAPLSELDLRAFVEPSLKYTNAMKKLKPQGFGLQDLWTGDGVDKNALLTIFRHGTSASVHQGLVGGQPLTQWVLNYSNFERIYYNLVADFEPWGSSAHKASTWNYMSRHRSEAEERFISFLPEAFRKSVRSSWTQGLGSAQNFSQATLSEGIKTRIVLKDTSAPVDSLLAQLYSLYSPQQLNPENQIVHLKHELANHLKAWGTEQQSRDGDKAWEQAFLHVVLAENPDVARYFPDVIYLRIGHQAYTILNHRFYKFNNLLALERLAYEPSRNQLYLLNGLIGDRPEYFIDLPPNEKGPFLADLRQITLHRDWVNFKRRYFVRRNELRVWAVSDWFIHWQAKSNAIDAGIIDLREYDLQTE